MKIAIIGTGGVGGYFGGRLAQSGNEVTFVARGEHFRVIRDRGLMVKSIHGDFKLESVRVVERISELDFPELVILGVKAWQVKEVAVELAEVIDQNTMVLPLQNGILAAEELCVTLPIQNVLGGLCRIISKIEAPGIICHFAVDPIIIFGELNQQQTARLEKIKQVFERAAINVRIAENIQAETWKKFISICTSGLLAVTRSSHGVVRELKETRELMLELLTEIYQLSQQLGVKLESDLVAQTVAYLEALPYDSTTSMARDIWAGRPSELEYQNGTVVRLGEKFHIPTPVNRFIYSTLLPLELKARKNRTEILR